MEKRIQYVRTILIKNGVTSAAFRYEKSYYLLRDSDSKFKNFTDCEIHSAILGMK